MRTLSGLKTGCGTAVAEAKERLRVTIIVARSPWARRSRKTLSQKLLESIAQLKAAQTFVPEARPARSWKGSVYVLDGLGCQRGVFLRGLCVHANGPLERSRELCLRQECLSPFLGDGLTRSRGCYEVRGTLATCPRSIASPQFRVILSAHRRR